MIDRRIIHYFDWINFLITVSLLGIGILFVFSTTYSEANPFSIFFKKQVVGVISGLIIYTFFSFKSLGNLSRIGYFGYFCTLALLLYTITGGWIGMGAQRWISLYLFRFQPSELAKLTLPLFMAFYFTEQRYLSVYQRLHPPFHFFMVPLIALGVGFLLILKQPDLGTALLVLFAGLLMLWILNITNKFFIIGILTTIIASPLLWHAMQPYQQQRILVLIGQGTSRHERYQIEQSKIAIGSGGILGKGLLKGTQNKLSFLPEDHTDFIFSVICEEWGFVGASFVLLLFLLLFWRLVSVTNQIEETSEHVIASGLIAHIMLSVCVNIGMVTGVIPIVGIPLPLLSYGLSNLWVTCASLGILNNIALRRYFYK